MKEALPIALTVETDRDAVLALIDTIDEDHLHTGYQHPAFLRAWVETGACQPVFIVVQAEGHGRVILPLERNAGGSAGYIGNRHANGNFPVGRVVDIEALGNDACGVVSGHESVAAAGLNTIMLERQYASWKGVANPFVHSGSVTSPNVALSFDLDDDFETVLANCPGSRKAKKFRNQMRKLESIGKVNIVIPVDAKDTHMVLEQFFAFKADRLRDAGIADVFADAGTKDAFHHMFRAPATPGSASHELHQLTVDGETAAIMGCTTFDKRMTVEFSTFNPKFAHAGPGDLLFYKAVQDAVARGFTTFDFGVGDEPFKRSWCDVETWHLDTFIAISARGQLQKLAKTMRSDLVRRLKSNDQLWNAAKAARRRLAARG